ncbi:hypothetical protein Tco_0213460 [Tanacetum coccineum]
MIENDRLLDKIISQEIVNIVLNSFAIICDSRKKNEDSVDTCNKCLEVEAELVKKNDVYIELSKRFSNLEQHCISLEVAKQLNKEIFQKDKSSDNQNHPENQEYFEQNDLKAQLQVKDTVIGKLKETIHSLRENVNPAKVKKDIDEIETINIELEHSVAKLLSENEKLHREKEHLKKTYKELYDSIKPSRVHAKEQCDYLIANLNSKSVENSDLKTQIQEKVFANAALKNKLRKLKGKNVIDIVVSKPYATTIALGMFKLNLEPLAPKVLKNKDAHLEYIKHSREHVDILWEIVKSSRALSPLDSNLDSALTVTPKNKDKKVRFADPVTSSSNTQKQFDPHKPKDSNQTLLHSTGVIDSTGASRSKPTGNTKNNRISQSSSSNKTNKVEDHSRSIKSRKNKKNRVAKTECNAYVMQSMLNMNSKSVCAIYNECLFDANHDKCVLDYVNDVNVLSKSKPAKRKNKKPISKPTGKVFTEIGYKWKPTRRTFTIVGNKCPLTSRRPKETKSVGCPNFSVIAKIMGYGDYHIGNVIISRVYYVEGLGHNLFSVGQFCDSNLEVAFCKHTCFVRNLEGVDLLTGSWGTNLYTFSIGIFAQIMVHNLSNKLCEAIMKMSVSLMKHPWHVLHNRTALSKDETALRSSEDLGKLKAKADVGIFIRYAPAKKAYLIYNRRTRRIMETIHVDFDDLIAIASKQSSSGPALHEMTPGTPSSGFVPQLPSSTPFVPPTRDEWDTLLQPLFDVYFRPPPCVDHPVPEVAALVSAVSTGLPSSTSVDQDAPSPSISQTLQASPSHVLTLSDEEADHDIEVAYMDNNPQFGIPIPKPSSEESSSQVVIPNNVHSLNQPPEHISK